MDKVGQYLSDLYTAWKVLLIAVALSFGFAFVYMLFLRCCAKVLVWITFFAFIILLVLFGYLFYDKGLNSLDSGDQLNYKVLGIIFWAIAGVVFFVILCLYDDIMLALTVIEESAKFIFSHPFTLLTPVIKIIDVSGYFVYWIVTVIYIYSCGTISQYKSTPFATVDWDDTTKQLWYYHLFALFWIVAFFIAILQFIIAATAAQWYFTSSSDQAGSGSLCKSLYWVFRYHLGSLAFGSLLLAIVMFVRCVFEYMKVSLVINRS